MENTNNTQCKIYKKCGGCQLQNMTYEEQLKWKQKRVQILLDKFGKVNPIIGMENPYHYRNKVQAAFRFDFRKKIIISGVYQSSTRSVVPVEYCMTEDKKADKIIGTIRKLMKSFKLLPYDERSGRGFLRHVLVKRGFASGETMVVLVAATPVFPSKNNFVKALLKEHPDITTIVLNVSDCPTNLVLGTNEKVLYGRGTIEDTLCGCRFRISLNPSIRLTLFRLRFSIIRQWKWQGFRAVKPFSTPTAESVLSALSPQAGRSRSSAWSLTATPSRTLSKTPAGTA